MTERASSRFLTLVDVRLTISLLAQSTSPLHPFLPVSDTQPLSDLNPEIRGIYKFPVPLSPSASIPHAHHAW